LKAKLPVVLAFIVFICGSVLMVSAETQTSVWRDEMNYQSLSQLEAGGWTVTHEDGVSFSGSAIVLDGTSQDTAIHYSNHFSSGISDWRVEDRSRWTLGSHFGNIVTAITNKHSYSFAADGWYGNYVFYRDGQKTSFGSFKESQNAWFTLAIEKQGNQINMYYNGEIKSTYTETDASTSQLIGVDAVSPWRGGSEYDYFEVWQIGDTSTQQAQESLLSNPIVIGGIIGVVGVGVGGVLYFFVLGGSGASGGAAGGATGGAGAGSAGSDAGGTGGTGSGSGGQGSLPLHNQRSQMGSIGTSPESIEHLTQSQIDEETSIQNLLAEQQKIDEDTSIQNLLIQQQKIDEETSIQNLLTEQQKIDEETSIQSLLMNQSQQNLTERIKPNEDVVTQQFEVPQDVTVNTASTQMGTRQKIEQLSDKPSETKTETSTEDDR
jgi:hypothetical protein